MAAIATVLNGVEFNQLVEGGSDAWKKLLLAMVVAIGGGLYGWTRKFVSDFDVNDLPLEWRQSFPEVPAVVPSAEDQPLPIATTADPKAAD